MMKKSLILLSVAFFSVSAFSHRGNRKEFGKWYD